MFSIKEMAVFEMEAALNAPDNAEGEYIILIKGAPVELKDGKARFNLPHRVKRYSREAAAAMADRIKTKTEKGVVKKWRQVTQDWRELYLADINRVVLT